MTIKFNKVVPGMVLHQWGRQRDVMRTQCSWPVEIVAVDADGRGATVRWNGNREEWWSAQQVSSLRMMSFYDAEKKKRKGKR